MTERLDRIEAITESNARAIASFAERQEEFANRFDAFIQRMDQQGLQVTLIRDLTDDQAGELIYTQERTEDNDLRIDALRVDAIADRLAFREEMAAQRTKADEDRTSWQRNFDAQLVEIRAQGEQIRALLSALATTNGRINNLEQAS